jgi:hypothetical protein
MRHLALIVAGLALSAEAPPPPQLQAFEQELSSSHFAEATAFVDKLIAEQTPTDGAPRPNPVLNAIIGHFYVAAGNYAGAGAYLNHAPIAELPQSLRAQTALDYGRALEARGDRAGALRAYQGATADSSDRLARIAASLGAARALLPENPAAAAAETSKIADSTDSQERWQTRYLLALSNSLRGDFQRAAALSDGAWADAADAPLTDLAPLHVAVLRAGLAAARHDTSTERAMLTIGGGLNVVANDALSAQLPVCGTYGIRPSDFVILGYISGPYGNRQLLPISASRLEIVKFFYDALAIVDPVRVSEADKPFGTIFTVQCRSVVSAGLITKPTSFEPMVEWMINKGIYPASVMYYSDDKHLNAVANRVDTLAAQTGKNSLLLIWPRLQLMQLLNARAHMGDPVIPGQITDLARGVSSGLRAAGAPPWLAGMADMQSQLIKLQVTDADVADRFGKSQTLMKDELGEMPAELAREVVTTMTSVLRGDWPAPAAQFVLDLSTKITPGLDDPERRSWLLTVAKAEQALGKNGEAQKTLASANLPPDLCVRMDQEPNLLRQQLSYDDYPQELIHGDQEGAVLYEFNLNSKGSVATYRPIYSLPSGLFDEASEKGVRTVIYSAPIRSGNNASCRAVYQPIIWRLESTANPDSRGSRRPSANRQHKLPSFDLPY